MSHPPSDTRYLLRLDDACATMPRRVWERVEATLAEVGVCPLAAVIPDNRDEKMFIDDPDPHFWRRVRRWQEHGWSIGVHGLHHTMRPRLGGKTEFAGLSMTRQEEMIDAALAIFAREGVRPAAWVAPNHSFDRTTVAILASRRLEVISDGHAVFPYRDRAGVLWIPQQLWRFEERARGLWTICRHPNGWDDEVISRFEFDVRRFADRLIDFRSAVEAYSDRRRDLRDMLFSMRRKAKKIGALGLRSIRARPAAVD